MKKFAISAMALALLASPLLTAGEAAAQNRPERARQELREDRREFRQDRREDRREFRQERREVRREIQQDRRQANRPVWLRSGGRYAGPRTYVDYRRYGLRAPARGQRWVRYNDTYVLVSIASGLIGAIIASQ